MEIARELCDSQEIPCVMGYFTAEKSEISSSWKMLTGCFLSFFFFLSFFLTGEMSEGRPIVESPNVSVYGFNDLAWK